MHARPVRHTVVGLALLCAGWALTACGSSSPSASGPTSSSTAATSSSTSTSAPSKSSASARLLDLLQQLDTANASLAATLTSMRIHNDAGTSYSASAVESPSSSVANDLQLALTELTDLLPSLAPGNAAVAESFRASLSGALQAFNSTDALANTASGQAPTPGVPSGLPSSLIASASGGSLIAPYQSDAGEVTTMERTTEHQFVTVLGAAGR